MRFPADDLGRIRRGEITAALRPYEGRPTSFRPADRFNSGLQRIELVSDVRTLVSQEGEPPRVIYHHPPKVVYERVVRTTDDYLEITGRTRLPLASLIEISVKALGFEDLADVVDAFCTDHGGLPEQSVWLIEFRLAGDLPRILAWPHSGKTGHDDYVISSGSKDALHGEPEGIEPELLDHYAAKNRERFLDQRRGRTERDEARRLERQLKEARKFAARTGADCSLEVAHIEHLIAEINRKAEEAKAA